MQVAVEVSMYPLVPDYEAPILAFIRGLHQHPGIEVATNVLSTQVTGEYDLVMAALQSEMKASFSAGPTISFVLKVLNVTVEAGKAVAV